jgi:hypothetical protein
VPFRQALSGQSVFDVQLPLGVPAQLFTHTDLALVPEPAVTQASPALQGMDTLHAASSKQEPSSWLHSEKG